MNPFNLFRSVFNQPDEPVFDNMQNAVPNFSRRLIPASIVADARLANGMSQEQIDAAINAAFERAQSRE